MRETLIDLLKNNGSIYFLGLPEIMPEIQGRCAMYMPIQEGMNPNVLWLDGVNEEFISVFNQLLITEQVIDWKPLSTIDLIYYGTSMYTKIPMATLRRAKYGKKECWLPILITKGKNFPF